MYLFFSLLLSWLLLFCCVFCLFLVSDSSHHYREPKGGEAAHIFSLYVYCTNPVMSFASCRLTDDYGSVSCSAYPLNTSCSSQLHWFVEASAADQQNQCQCSVTVTSGSSQYRAQKTCLDKAIGKNASIIAVVENQIVTAIPTAKFTIRLDKTESGKMQYNFCLTIYFKA